MLHHLIRPPTTWEKFLANLPPYLGGRPRCHLRHPIHCQWFHILLGILLATLLFGLLAYLCKHTKCCRKAAATIKNVGNKAATRVSSDEASEEVVTDPTATAKKRKKQN
eukprot:Blabericola_migrator_1__4042@NODE_222_length_11195_cov_65_275341_g188_i0_p6_GENE_NODE_222_length_11195_cov_65_275341_g188_i0NODE_222_length_11195_cov_65_275341_g188_i0_p6_ORF_typecomplete_len109_score20_37TMEM52/PF14979_6/0_003Clclike/PF07062_12/0_0037SPT_ssulike/PF11779_8/0_0069DUF2254/PF10011_9/0_0067Herpes_gE/PF02480_16/0_016YdjM/PF04307_14/0_079TAS2R/PF05296_13/0_11DUF5589/PF17672_1/0_2DUF5589/PF17672_1/4_2e03DUF3649/PF12365_8/2_6_NODE_222_length_11195_cov_65_275341_g188_i042564582